MKAVGLDQPLFVRRAEGAYLETVEGERLVDWVMSFGPLIFGHSDAGTVEAVRAAAGDGTTFGASTEREVELAAEIVDAFPSIEQVRLVSSGTEAAMSAIRLARGATKRDRILKFAGCYHGHADSLLAEAGSGPATLGVPATAGVPAGATADTIIAPYNDVVAAARAVERWGEGLACVIVEPVAGNMGVVPPEPGFLEALRELCDASGALLVFDEVITGFRLALGGAQQVYGVAPDMTCLGKIIGGGLPVGAYGGRADIMAKVAPEGPVYQAGTLSGNPLAMAAGRATLDLLEEKGVYERLEALGARLEQGLVRAAKQAGVTLTVNRAGSLLTPFFCAGPVTDYESAKRSDTARFARFFHAMLDRGFYLPPAQFEALFLSLAHTEADVDRTIAAAGEALAAVA